MRVDLSGKGPLAETRSADRRFCGSRLLGRNPVRSVVV